VSIAGEEAAREKARKGWEKKRQGAKITRAGLAASRKQRRKRGQAGTDFEARKLEELRTNDDDSYPRNTRHSETGGDGFDRPPFVPRIHGVAPWRWVDLAGAAGALVGRWHGKRRREE